MKPAPASLCSSIHDLAAARSGSGWVLLIQSFGGLASSLRGFADKGKYSESNCDVKEQNQFDEFEV